MEKGKEYWHKANAFLERLFRNETAIQVSFWIILALNVFYKFFFLEEMHVKHDDAFTIFHSQQSLSELYAVLSKEANPPLYFTLLHFWIKLFGIGPVAVKSLSAIFSTGAAVVIFQIGKKHMNLLGAITASLLFLFSNIHFDFSHEVRAFSLVFLLSSLSVYFFLNLLEKTNWKTIITLCIVNALLPYTHYTSVLLPVTEAIILIFLIPNRFKDLLKIAGGFALSALLFVPQLLNFKDTIPDDDFWLDKPSPEILKFAFLKLSGHDPSYRNIKYALFAGILLITVNLFFRTFKKQFDFKKFIFFVAVFFIPIYLNYFIAQYSPVFRVRYMLFSGIGPLLALAYLFSLIRLKPVFQIVFAAYFILSFQKDFGPINQNIFRWDHAAEAMTLNHSNNTECYIVPYWRMHDFTYYYKREAFENYSSVYEDMNELSFHAINDSNGINRLHVGKSICIISCNPQDADPEKTIESFLIENNYNPSDSIFTSLEINIVLWTQD